MPDISSGQAAAVPVHILGYADGILRPAFPYCLKNQLLLMIAVAVCLIIRFLFANVVRCLFPLHLLLFLGDDPVQLKELFIFQTGILQHGVCQQCQ